MCAPRPPTLWRVVSSRRSRRGITRKSAHVPFRYSAKTNTSSGVLGLATCSTDRRKRPTYEFRCSLTRQVLTWTRRMRAKSIAMRRSSPMSTSGAATCHSRINSWEMTACSPALPVKRSRRATGRSRIKVSEISPGVDKLDLADLVDLRGLQASENLGDHRPKFASAENVDEVLLRIAANEHTPRQRIVATSPALQPLPTERLEFERASIHLGADIDRHLVHKIDRA